jgi:hypothetical protein
MAERIPEHLRPAIQRRPECLMHWHAAADRGEPAQLHGKQQHEQKTQPVDGHGNAKLGEEHGDGIDPGALTDSRQDAEGDADHAGKQKSNDGEFDGRAKPTGDDLAHRLVLEDGAAHVALQQGGKVVPQPNEPGVIEAKRIAQILDRLGRSVLAQKHSSRITRNDKQQAKGHHDHADGHGDEEEQAAGNVGEHGDLPQFERMSVIPG